jgi:hypothetical protein
LPGNVDVIERSTGALALGNVQYKSLILKGIFAACQFFCCSIAPVKQRSSASIQRSAGSQAQGIYRWAVPGKSSQ